MRQRNSGVSTQLYQTNLFENSIFSKMPEGVRPGGLMLTQRLVDYCNFEHGAIAIDIGCGTGTTVEYLRNVRGVHAVGVDLSAVLLEQGRKRTIDLQLIQSPGEDLPFTDNSIDGVLVECSLSVMPDAGRVLAEVNRILVPGGKLAITDLYTREAGYEKQLPGIMTYSEIIQILQGHCFDIMVFEDQSALLREFVAGFIMEHGSAEELWKCIGMEMNDRKNLGLGYYLLVAKKCSPTTTHSK